MLKKVFVFLTGAMMMGCKTVQSVFDPPSVIQEGVEVLEVAPIGACAPILGWLGGVCALGGMILLVISRGTLGWRPLIGGIAFILINYALAIYANWFFFPVAIATGAISLAWAGKIIWKIVNDDKIKLKGLKL